MIYCYYHPFCIHLLMRFLFVFFYSILWHLNWQFRFVIACGQSNVVLCRRMIEFLLWKCFFLSMNNKCLMQTTFGSFHLIAAISIFLVQKIDEVSRPSLIDRLKHFVQFIYEQPAANSLSICQPIACATLLFTNFSHNYFLFFFSHEI